MEYLRGKDGTPRLKRDGWPKGDWDNEEDYRSYVFHGLPCVIIRGPVGSLCGYVGIPKDHPNYGMDYDHVDVQVHGGITFSKDEFPWPIKGEKCPVKADWIFGFDCAHLGDLSPDMVKNFSGIFYGRDDTYKNWSCVLSEVEQLAAQLRNLWPVTR